MKPRDALGAIFICLLCVLPFTASSREQTGPFRFERYRIASIPFQVGERLEYQFGWNGIPSARAVATVEKTVIDGKEYYLMRCSSWTNKLVEILWRMRDRGMSIVDMVTLQPVHHQIYREENDRRRRHTVKFDHEKKVASCTREKLELDEVDKIKLSFQYAFDPISVSYYMRALHWDVGDVKRAEFIENNHRYMLTMKVLGRERINVAAGTFRTLKVEPKLTKLSGTGTKLKEKLKEAYLWVTDDERHIPVKLKSSVFIGHVYADLVRYTIDGKPVRE